MAQTGHPPFHTLMDNPGQITGKAMFVDEVDIMSSRAAAATGAWFRREKFNPKGGPNGGDGGDGGSIYMRADRPVQHPASTSAGRPPLAGPAAASTAGKKLPRPTRGGRDHPRAAGHDAPRRRNRNWR